MNVKIKICGMTRSTDIQAAVGAGADAIGLVFVPASPRCVSFEQARILAEMVPAEVQLVGLFMNASAKTVSACCKQVPLTALQFHGFESNDECRQFGLPWIKTVAMGGEQKPASLFDAWPDACALLLDGHAAGEQGGQGKVFDWLAAPQIMQKIILAGGLNSDNVSTAIEQVKPWAVDVSSGVEAAPAKKDIQLMKRFCNEVRATRI
ncbi:MAG: phosphoribosylanthranilate isomerase [Proteobacteria bacterium]|nr:phosphoribosylanthranilate isomerase [Pseudomonadota bacterium]